MKYIQFIIILLIITLSVPVSAESFSAGTDLVSTIYSAIMECVSINIQFDFPLTKYWSLNSEFSFYLAKSLEQNLMQNTLKFTARIYFPELFGNTMPYSTHDGLFINFGGAVGWGYTDIAGESPFSILSAGPIIGGGWRFSFGSNGIFIEPYTGWMALFGSRIPEGADNSFMWNQGFIGGTTLGWSF